MTAAAAIQLGGSNFGLGGGLGGWDLLQFVESNLAQHLKFTFCQMVTVLNMHRSSSPIDRWKALCVAHTTVCRGSTHMHFVM